MIVIQPAGIRVLPQFAVTAYNDVYYGSSNAGRLIKLDSDKYTDYNDKPIIRKRISPIYFSNNNIVTIRSLLVDMEVGRIVRIQVDHNIYYPCILYPYLYLVLHFLMVLWFLPLLVYLIRRRHYHHQQVLPL